MLLENVNNIGFTIAICVVQSYDRYFFLAQLGREPARRATPVLMLHNTVISLHYTNRYSKLI